MVFQYMKLWPDGGEMSMKERGIIYFMSQKCACMIFKYLNLWPDGGESPINMVLQGRETDEGAPSSGDVP